MTKPVDFNKARISCNLYRRDVGGHSVELTLSVTIDGESIGRHMVLNTGPMLAEEFLAGKSLKVIFKEFSTRHTKGNKS